tara:strand:+ start:1193 stop:1594 length:402 start_codon:yes stop_codon:yes gene_type:complete
MDKKKKKPVGRPKTHIDEVELKRVCVLQLTMPEIAAYFDIPLRTLEDRVKAEPKLKEIIQNGRERGKISVRRKQFQIMDEDNNATMAIWLGKQLLGQRDKHDLVTEDKSSEKLTQAFDMIAKMARNKADEDNA